MTTRGRRLTLYLADEDESESNDIRVNEMKVWGHREVIQRLHSIGTVQVLIIFARKCLSSFIGIVINESLHFGTILILMVITCVLT